MSSPEKVFADGTSIPWRKRSVGALGVAARIFRAQQGAREIAGVSSDGRSGVQQQLPAARSIQGQKK